MAHPRAHARDMARQTVPASCPRTARRRPAPGTPHRWELGESFCHPSRSTRRTSAPRNTAARSRKDKASRVRRASRVQGAGPTRRRGTYVGEAEGEGWDGMRTGKWDGATRPLSAERRFACADGVRCTMRPLRCDSVAGRARSCCWHGSRGRTDTGRRMRWVELRT